jgi:hypothetical protein
MNMKNWTLRLHTNISPLAHRRLLRNRKTLLLAPSAGGIVGLFGYRLSACLLCPLSLPSRKLDQVKDNFIGS